MLRNSMNRMLYFFIILAFLVSGCSRSEKPTPQTEKAEGDLNQKVLKFNLASYADRGMKRWEVKGESADIIGEVIELANIVATNYGEENSLSLKADKGIYDKPLNKIHFEGNVVILSKDGAEVLTDSLDWDSHNNIISTDAPLEIKRREIKVWGRGAKGEPELKQVHLYSDIKIEMDNGATVITCDGPLDVDYEKNVAAFSNNVKISDEKGEVTSRRLEAYLNPETKVITKAVATGEVKILRDNNYSYSDEVVYLADEHKVTLTGRPQLVIYPDEKADISLFGEKNGSR